MEHFKIKLALSSIIFSTFTLQACSTTQKSIGTGAGIGMAAGAGVGAIADPGPNGKYRFRNVVIGSAVGAVAGAGVGYALDRHNHDEREDAKKEGKKEAEDEQSRRSDASSSSGSPQLIPPKTEAKWIPDQTRGSTFVPGHFEYVIVSPAHWEASQ